MSTELVAGALSRKSLLPCLLAFLVGCSDEVAQPTASATHRGKDIYEKNCKVCHAQGLNGAPILGNRAMWDKRMKPEADLVTNAVNGFGLMPANIGRNDLTEEQIAYVVNYMLSELK